MNIAKIMKQAQKMQGEMQKIQQDLANRKYEGTAGGGAVKALVTGENQLQSIEISPDLLSDGDVEILQDMIVTAVGEANTKAKEEAQAELGKMTSGLGLPPGMGL